MRVEELSKFVIERHNIYLRRLEGKPKPWTQDPILQKYRFCNVYRELDAVTQWIARNWRNPNKRDPYIWFAMTVARFINLPDTLNELGYPVPWNRKRFLQLLDNRSTLGLSVYNGAYMVRSDPGSKAIYLANLFDNLWNRKDNLTEVFKDSDLINIHFYLTQQRGIGSFMAGQIIADIKYVLPYLDAGDWASFACMGPGSARGLARVLNYPVDYKWKEQEWFTHHTKLCIELNTILPNVKMKRMHAQDVRKCLCEFDKYERARLGEGRPKSLYPGAA